MITPTVINRACFINLIDPFPSIPCGMQCFDDWCGCLLRVDRCPVLECRIWWDLVAAWNFKAATAQTSSLCLPSYLIPTIPYTQGNWPSRFHTHQNAYTPEYPIQAGMKRAKKIISESERERKYSGSEKIKIVAHLLSTSKGQIPKVLSSKTKQTSSNGDDPRGGYRGDFVLYLAKRKNRRCDEYYQGTRDTCRKRITSSYEVCKVQ